MTTTLARAPTTPAPPPDDDPRRRVSWRRLRRPLALFALVASALASLGQALGTVVAGRLAEDPAGFGVAVLAALVVGGAAVDTVGRVVWATVVDRAEGQLRDDLLTSAFAQPLATLTEQAVGEVLDRVDDDTHEVGTLLRLHVWQLFRTVFGVLPMWCIAGVTWWPAWLLFPLLAVLTGVAIRPLLGEISRRKVIEEMAWTDHAAALEEGIAGRDDLRTSLGQAHVVRRLAQLSSDVHTKFAAVLERESRVTSRAGLLLHGLMAAVVVAGVAAATADGLSVARLVTLFLVTATFVGQISMLAQHLPDLQAGLGAIVRIRQMLDAEPEPAGGRGLPDGPLELELRDLQFRYDEGSFALRDLDLHVPAGQTVALVGRTGSGKSTVAALLSRAVEPPPGTVFIGGVDVSEVDLTTLRSAVGVVTQRTEILAGTLAENIALFDPDARPRVESAVAELGLGPWVAGLPDGLDTPLGPGGTPLSSGEEQLVAFARLLVRDVQVVVLDEATARMDPATESRVVAAADRLLRGRTGVLVAHRLSTTERAELVAVLDHGHIVQQGRRADLAARPGPFRALVDASGAAHGHHAGMPLDATAVAADAPDVGPPEGVGGRRRIGPPPPAPEVGPAPSLARGIWHALAVRPQWGYVGAVTFLVISLISPQGALTGWLWGHVVVDLESGGRPWLLVGLLALGLLVGPLLLAEAIRRYPRWWIEVMLRTRMSVLVGQTRQRRLSRTPPGEVVARSMDADRFARYADRWVDFINGLVVAGVTAAIAGSWLAGAVLLAVMVASALASTLGRPIAGRSVAASSAARARFGRMLVSALESARTVKLAAATPAVHAQVRRVDSGRIRAAITEHRVQAFLDGVPIVMVQCGVVAAWAALVWGWWGLATALLVANAVSGFDWFGRVAGSVVTEAPGTRVWQRVTTDYAGGGDLMDLPDGVDLVSGAAPDPEVVPRVRLQRLDLAGFSAIHDDGTIGVSGVDLTVEPGELVLLAGQVGSGKSSLLSALAGLVDHRGILRWNDQDIEDPQRFLRPGQVAHVAQVPRVLSGTFADNVRLGHVRGFDRPVADARLESDVHTAGGQHALVGHRGVRLSGGQVQRLALARALAADAELLLADDVSSALDATTEVELWRSLRARRTTVIGATAKEAALAQADRVVVLMDGEVAATGPWEVLAARWGHLAG